MNRRDLFFEFEVKNKLFDIVDDQGLRPWEAVRYDVYNNICYGFGGNTPLRKSRWKLFYIRIKHLVVILHSFCSFIFYVLCHRHSDIMFLIASRDKKDGVVYDCICGDFYELVDKKTKFTFETMCTDRPYMYKGQVCTTDFYKLWRKLPWKCYNFRMIYSMIIKEFPFFSMNQNDLNRLYQDFYAQYYFYKILFRLCRTKKVFLVQNGIHKGLFAAAQIFDLEVLEFQHGQLSKNHPAYSYPDSLEITSDKIYHPSKLLTFGPFWNKGRYYPGVENVVIGNDSYADDIEIKDTHGNRKILVISNMYDSEFLSNYVKEILRRDSRFSFFYKLHPNQYKEKAYYDGLFAKLPMVDVISDRLSINQCLAESEAILLIHSTVELEALRAGRKVFVIKEGAFEAMDFVFSEKGVYLVDGPDSFLESYQSHNREFFSPRNDLFVPFQMDVATKLLM